MNLPNPDNLAGFLQQAFLTICVSVVYVLFNRLSGDKKPQSEKKEGSDTSHELEFPSLDNNDSAPTPKVNVKGMDPEVVRALARTSMSLQSMLDASIEHEARIQSLEEENSELKVQNAAEATQITALTDHIEDMVKGHEKGIYPPWKPIPQQKK